MGNLDFHPTLVFLFTMAFSMLLFFVVRLVMHLLYVKILSRWHFISQTVGRLQQDGTPLLRKYGTLGLVLFVALPLPGTGVIGGTILSWLTGCKWYISFLAIVPASAVPNILTTASIIGLLHLA